MCGRLPFSTEYMLRVPAPQGADSRPSLQCHDLLSIVTLLSCSVWSRHGELRSGHIYAVKKWSYTDKNFQTIPIFFFTFIYSSPSWWWRGWSLILLLAVLNRIDKIISKLSVTSYSMFYNLSSHVVHNKHSALLVPLSWQIGARVTTARPRLGWPGLLDNVL